MERLTEKHYLATDHYMRCSEFCNVDMDCIDCPAFDRLVERLAAYENTGLTPEQCAEYGKAGREGRYIVLRDAEQEGVKRLRELAKADKEGRLVVLPCKVGSTVYTEFCDEIVEKRIGQFHVNSYTEPRLWADIDCDWTSTQCVRWDLAIGKTIFLTREEAEAALEAMKNGN